MNKTAVINSEYGDIELTVDLEVFSDMETIEILTDLQSGQPESIVKWPVFIQRIFGAEQKTKIYDLLRDKETGRVPIDRVTTFVTDAINIFSKKN